MSKFIKGTVERKIPLSFLEKLAGASDEKEEITFNIEDISSFSNEKNGKSIVVLKTMPFENIEDFQIICNTTDLADLV